MKIVVIGAGLIGVTAAYLLRLRGHEVTVLDRQDGPGRETSFANGGLLTPGMPHPWNAPGCWRVLLRSLVHSDAPLKLRVSALPGLAGWGLRFLANSSRARFDENTLSNVRLALYSLRVMHAIRERVSIDIGAKAPGTLQLFRSTAALDAASTAAERLRIEGLSSRILSGQECIDLEPVLTPIGAELAGAICYEADESGDAYSFCVGLTQEARRQGVEFAFGMTVAAVEIASDAVTAVRARQTRPSKDGERKPERRYAADCYLLTAGSYSPQLARPLGIFLPVRPAKGYSVTFNAPDSPRWPPLRIPIVDAEMHAAVVPLGNVIRAAGTAEFAGFDLQLRPEPVRDLVRLAQRLLPRGGLDISTARTWCGLRPMSADGVPLIGRTSLRNLWVSTGHGHLGWTLAAGSGELLADLLAGDVPAVDPRPYDPSRFT